MTNTQVDTHTHTHAHGTHTRHTRMPHGAHGTHTRAQVEILAAEKDVYAAKIDDALLLVLGPGHYAVDGGGWRSAETGNGFAVYERNAA